LYYKGAGVHTSSSQDKGTAPYAGAIPLFSDIYINVRRPAHGTGANERDDSPETIVGFYRILYAAAP